MMFYEIVAEIREERCRQFGRWGNQSGHDPLYWMTILSKEHGEVAKALLENADQKALEKELIQVAAVCFAWLEEGFN